MLKNALLLVLIVSLAFNMAFVGTWVYKRRVEHRQAFGGPPHPQWAALGLSPDQQQALRESWRAAGAWIEELRAEAAHHRNALLDLMAADKPDMQAVAGEEGRLEAIEEEVRWLVIGQMVQTRELLTSEQRAEWLRMTRARGEAAMWGGMYGGSRQMETHGPDHGQRPGTTEPGTGSGKP
jgi:Spy/CpxP family protein refolding chaperone